MNTEIFVKAERVSSDWSLLSARERGEFIRRLGERIVCRQVEIARTVALETGRSVTEVVSQEITASLEMLRFFRKNYPRWLSDRRFRYPRPGFWRKSNVIVLEPLGLMGVIGPGNLPFSLPVMACSAGLLCGNTVLLKPSERCPKTAEIIRSLGEEAGFPEGVFGVVMGGAETACEVAAHPAVRKVIFFGPAPAGRQMAELCGRHFKPCVLELGGRNAAIVCRDADLKRAARGLVWSAFSAAGNSCVAMNKIFVEASVYQDFIALLRREMKALRAGDVLDPSADLAPRSKPPDLELDLSAEENPGPAKPELKPSLTVQRVASVEQAVEDANAYLSGLGASIWSRDLNKAGTIARKLRAGLVWVNDCSVGLPQFPWGGTREDGWGRLFAESALTELVNLKVISIDRPAGASRKFWWFPYSERKYQILLALNEALFGKKSLAGLTRLFSSLIGLRARGKKR